MSKIFSLDSSEFAYKLKKSCFEFEGMEYNFL